MFLAGRKNFCCFFHPFGREKVQKKSLSVCAAFLGFKKIGKNLAPKEKKRRTLFFYETHARVPHKIERENSEEAKEGKKIYARENKNGTNAGEVKRSDLRHFLEQSRNHGLLRPRRLERDLEENRRRMVRRDRVRDRTDRGDRDVSVIVFSQLSFVRSSFVVVSEKDGVLVSLSLVLFLNAEQMRRRGTQRRERERRKNPPRDHHL